MLSNFRFMLLAMAIPFVLLLGCAEEGPAEKAGSKLDDAIESVKDAIDPAGPAEKAGRKVDDAVENVTGNN